MDPRIPAGNTQFNVRRVIGAAIGSEIAVWLSRKVTDLTGNHLGTLLDTIMPLGLQSYFSKATDCAQIPIQWIGGKFIRTVPKELITVVLAPILEEVVYRYGIQQGAVLVLEASGFNSTLAKTMSIGIASFMFGMAHHRDITQDRFVSTMIPGIVYGLVQEHGGLAEAITVHSLSNLYVEISERLKW